MELKCRTLAVESPLEYAKVVRDGYLFGHPSSSQESVSSRSVLGASSLSLKFCRLVAAVLAIAMSSGVFAQQPIVIKFSHVVATDTPKGKASVFFAAKAAELTEGRVRVEVFANSILYKDREELEALQLGAVQMLAPSLAKFGPLGIKEFELFDLPYIFDDYNELHRVTAGPVGKKLLGKLEAKGLVGLAFWDNGFKVMSANRPINAPADYKDLKMRIQPSNVLDAQMRALGAIPQKMAFSEVYQALLTGVVDGTENPPSNLYTQKMHEVQKYVTVTNHGYLGYAVITNKKFWEGLPADVRSALEEAMIQATEYANRIAQEENDLALSEVRRSGKSIVVIPNAEQKMAMKKILVPVHEEMANRIGRENIEAVYQAIAGLKDAKLGGATKLEVTQFVLKAWPWLLFLVGIFVLAINSTKMAIWLRRFRGMT